MQGVPTGIGEEAPHLFPAVAVGADEDVNVVAADRACPDRVPSRRGNSLERLRQRLSFGGIKPERREVQEFVRLTVERLQVLPARLDGLATGENRSQLFQL